MGLTLLCHMQQIWSIRKVLLCSTLVLIPLVNFRPYLLQNKPYLGPNLQTRKEECLSDRKYLINL